MGLPVKQLSGSPTWSRAATFLVYAKRKPSATSKLNNHVICIRRSNQIGGFVGNCSTSNLLGSPGHSPLDHFPDIFVHFRPTG